MADPAKQMQSDWDAYWATTAPDTVIDWANGQLTKSQGDTATYSSNGKSLTFNQETPWGWIASKAPEIANEWNNAYGYWTDYKPPSQPSGAESTIPWADYILSNFGNKFSLQNATDAAWKNGGEMGFYTAPNGSVTGYGEELTLDPRVYGSYADNFGPHPVQPVPKIPESGRVQAVVTQPVSNSGSVPSVQSAVADPYATSNFLSYASNLQSIDAADPPTSRQVAKVVPGSGGLLGAGNANYNSELIRSLRKSSLTPFSANQGVDFYANQGKALSDSEKQMQSDWNAYWNNVSPGTTIDWVNGKLTRNADGTATYSTGNNNITFNQNTPFDELALKAPDVAEEWNKNYKYWSGWKPTSSGGSAFNPQVFTPRAATDQEVADWNAYSAYRINAMKSSSPVLSMAEWLAQGKKDGRVDILQFFAPAGDGGTSIS